jgi:hypothetical protein
MTRMKCWNYNRMVLNNPTAAMPGKPSIVAQLVLDFVGSADSHICLGFHLRTYLRIFPLPRDIV